MYELEYLLYLYVLTFSFGSKSLPIFDQIHRREHMQCLHRSRKSRTVTLEWTFLHLHFILTKSWFFPNTLFLLPRTSGEQSTYPTLSKSITNAEPHLKNGFLNWMEKFNDKNFKCKFMQFWCSRDAFASSHANSKPSWKFQQRTNSHHLLVASRQKAQPLLHPLFNRFQLAVARKRWKVKNVKQLFFFVQIVTSHLYNFKIYARSKFHLFPEYKDVTSIRRVDRIRFQPFRIRPNESLRKVLR